MRKFLGRIRRRLTARMRGVAAAAGQIAAAVPGVIRIAAGVGHEVILRLRGAERDKRRVRVGIDVTAFYEPLTGVGWYLQWLVSELAKRDDLEFVFFGSPLTPPANAKLFARLPAGHEPLTFQTLRERPSSYERAAASAAFSLVAWLRNCDLFFAPNYFLPAALDRIAPHRVVTIHDLTWRRFPELLQQETLRNLSVKMMREIALSDSVICVSEATRKDLLSYYEMSQTRAVTIHSGMSSFDATSHSSSSLPGRYILFVSTIEPRKNLEILVEAFERIRDDASYAGDLVVVGKIGWKSEATRQRMLQSRWKQAIHHLDYIERDQLSSIYRGAEMFVLPSLLEGFGFPILEAMAHGVPVIAANTSSLPEVGGDAAMYFHPHDAKDLATAIRKVAQDGQLRDEMTQRGRERIQQFPWSGCAEQTARLFLRVAGHPIR